MYNQAWTIMGRTFENRRLTMLKRSDRDAKAFSRAGRQIAMAVKAGGGDPEASPALRRAIQNARGVNMPKDKIQYAIDKAAGNNDGDNFEQIFRGVRSARHRADGGDGHGQPHEDRGQRPVRLQEGTRESRDLGERRVHVRSARRLSALSRGHRA